VKVVIIDDEQLAIDVLEMLLNKIKGIEIVGKYTDPQIALLELPQLDIEVAFIDMEMGELHGLELAEIIQSKFTNALEVVFVTAYPEFALDAFEVSAIDYLLKPVNQERLSKTIVKLEKRLAINYQHQQKLDLEKQDLFVQAMGNFHLLDTRGNKVKWRTRKVKELFIILWHHRDKGIHRSELIASLWPEITEDRAVTLLHTTVYQLRKMLKGIDFENPVILRNEYYVFNFYVNSDLDLLKKILRSSSRNASTIKDVLELYHGDYLEVDNYDWASSRQEKMRGLFLEYLGEFVLNERASGNYPHLVETCLKKMVKLEPYKEQYVYLLLDYYGQKRDLQKMVILFQEIKKKWIKELGVDIPKEIQDLYVKYII
jgi:two-component SAPR family response regulator